MTKIPSIILEAFCTQSNNFDTTFKKIYFHKTRSKFNAVKKKTLILKVSHIKINFNMIETEL